MWVFKCLCFPYLLLYRKHKMDFRSSSCVFLGYSSSHLGYRCLDIHSGRIYIARHVRFDEYSFPFSGPSLLGPKPTQAVPNSPWAMAPTIPQSFSILISPTTLTRRTTAPSTSYSPTLSPISPQKSPGPTPKTPIPSAPPHQTNLLH